MPRALLIIGAVIALLYAASLAGVRLHSQPSPVSINGQPVPMPAFEFGAASQRTIETDAAPAAAATSGGLQACRPYKLTDELQPGHALGKIVHAGDITIEMEGANAAVMYSIDTGMDLFGAGLQGLKVNKGTAITAVSTSSLTADITQPMGATYTVRMPADRKPYKKIIFYMYGLKGSYTYAMYDSAGKMLFDPPLRDVTFSPPGKYMPETAYITLQVKGQHTLQIEAVC